MYKLNHPNIIQLYNHFEDDQNVYLIQEFAGRGALNTRLSNKGRFDDRTCKYYMYQITQAINYLHN